MAQATLSEYLSIVQCFYAIVLVYVMRRWADRRLFRWHTFSAIFLAYLSAGSLALIVPLDMAVTIKGRVSSTYDDSQDDHVTLLPKLRDAYESLFWPSFVLGTFVLAWQEIYAQNGHFTVPSRMADATRRLLKWWSTMAVGGVIFMVILLATGATDASSSALQATIIALSNTYGLAVIVLLLGYGLVELPRDLWKKSDLETRLHQAQQAAAVEYKKMTDQQLAISQSVADAVKTRDEVNRLADPDLLRCMEVVMGDCPAEFHSGTGGNVARDKHGEVTVASLAVLRRKLNLDKVAFQTCQGRVERCKQLAFYAEDVLEAEDADNESIQWSFGVEPSTKNEWLWHTKFKPLTFKVLAVAASFMSFCIMLGELGAMSGPETDLSLFSVVVHSDSTSFRGITTFTVITLGYTAYATFWSLSQLRIANMMELLPNQQTSPKSMSFNARQVCRLVPALVYNYLGFMHESGKQASHWDKDSAGNPVNSAFSMFYGEQMAVVPFIGDDYNLYFPVLILVFALCQLFNVFNRMLVAIKLHKLQFGEETISDAQREQGTKLLKREREKLERRAESDQRKKRYQKMKRKSFIQRMFDSGAKTNDTETAALAGAELATMESGAMQPRRGPAKADMPPALRYMLEKKSPNKLQGWQPRYFVLQAPGRLLYYTGSNAPDPLGVVDLRSLHSVDVHSKAGQTDPRRINVHVGDRTFKLRCVSQSKAEEWTDALLAWKEYALAHAGDEVTGVTIHEGDEHEHGHVLSHESDDEGHAGASSGHAGASIAAQDSMDDPWGAPEVFSGMLKKRSPSRLKGWQDRFFEIVPPHSLVYYKGADNQAERAGAIDLRLVVSVDVYCKEGKSDPKRLNIDLGDRVMKLMTASPEETERWLKALTDWQEYALLNDHGRAGSVSEMKV